MVKLVDGGELWAAQQEAEELRQQLHRLNNDLTACQLERNEFERNMLTWIGVAAEESEKVKALQLERDRLQREHEIWDKHSLVQIVEERDRLRAGLLGHACYCGSNDPDPSVHRDDCAYRKWASPESSSAPQLDKP